jgi:ethanolamine utilization protein EutA
VASACLNVGGHLVELDGQGRIKHLHAPARTICRELFPAFDESSGLSLEQLQVLARRMAQLLHEVVSGELSSLARQLLMTEPLPKLLPLHAVTLSGGVGQCYYQDRDEAPLRYGDIGPLLAGALRDDAGFRGLPMREPKQTVRATVIGAGAHSLSLSGSTIWLRELQLPMRNIPVVHGMPGLPPVEGWNARLAQLDLRPGEDLYALALADDLPITYRALQGCVEQLAAFQRLHPNPHPLLVVASQDLGKALGMLLQPSLAGRALAVIDEVATSDGDYIDIGSPIFDGEILPVTVKSLAFPT